MFNISENSDHLILTSWIQKDSEKNDNNSPLHNLVGSIKNYIYNQFNKNNPTTFLDVNLKSLYADKKTYLKIVIHLTKHLTIEEIDDIYHYIKDQYPQINFQKKK